MEFTGPLHAWKTRSTQEASGQFPIPAKYPYGSYTLYSLVTTDSSSLTNFDLSYFMVAFLPFSFFIAYLMSIPAGMLIEKYHEKLVMSAAFLLAGIGALLFALVPVFSVAVISLFLIGI